MSLSLNNVVDGESEARYVDSFVESYFRAFGRSDDSRVRAQTVEFAYQSWGRFVDGRGAGLCGERGSPVCFACAAGVQGLIVGPDLCEVEREVDPVSGNNSDENGGQDVCSGSVSSQTGSAQSETVLGPNTLRNRRWREEKKKRKLERKAVPLWRRKSPIVHQSIQDGFPERVGGGVKEIKEEVGRLGDQRELGVVVDELKESVRQKWIAKNKLERLEAERRIFVLQSNDVDAEIKRYRTKVGVQTERNMVAMEKAHAILVETGNVPRDCGGVEDAGSRVCTMVTDKSGSISPDSSASQAEFRAVQKKNLDQEAQILEMKEMIKQFGVSYEALKKADQMTFTDNTENGIIMDELYPKGIGCHFVDRGGISKLRIGCEDY